MSEMYGFKCEYCDGTVEEKITTEDFWHKGTLIVLEHVPVGICNKCKNRYYSAEVLEKLEEAFQNRARLRRMQVPVYDYAMVG